MVVFSHVRYHRCAEPQTINLGPYQLCDLRCTCMIWHQRVRKWLVYPAECICNWQRPCRAALVTLRWGDETIGSTSILRWITLHPSISRRAKRQIMWRLRCVAAILSLWCRTASVLICNAICGTVLKIWRRRTNGATLSTGRKTYVSFWILKRNGSRSNMVIWPSRRRRRAAWRLKRATATTTIEPALRNRA